MNDVIVLTFSVSSGSNQCGSTEANKVRLSIIRTLAGATRKGLYKEIFWHVRKYLNVIHCGQHAEVPSNSGIYNVGAVVTFM